MKKRERGFTLVELLAVIVILGLLALVIVPNVASTLKNKKNSLYKTQIKLIEGGAESWAAEHFFELPSSDGAVLTIHLKDLDGLIDIEINNPKEKNKNFGKCLEIDIIKRTGVENYTYVVNEATINNDSGC